MATMRNDNDYPLFHIYRYKAIDQLNAKSLPTSDYLHHYTTLQGCLGILQSKCIWTSDARCVNDTREISYGIDRICDALLRWPVAASDRSWLESTARYTKSFPKNVFIASFSAASDHLSQWRAYGRNGGVSIGFRFEEFATACRRDQAVLGPVTYSVQQQELLVTELLAELFLRQEAAEKTKAEEHEQSIQINFAVNAVMLAAFLKHEKFEDENEWRVVVQFEPQDQIKVRASSSLLIPYSSIDLSFAMKKDAGLRLMVGPMPHAMLVKDVLTDMLGRAHSVWVDASVTASEVPYRDW